MAGNFAIFETFEIPFICIAQMSGIIDYVADGLDLLFVIFGCVSTRSIEEYLVFIVAL